MFKIISKKKYDDLVGELKSAERHADKLVADVHGLESSLRRARDERDAMTAENAKLKTTITEYENTIKDYNECACECDSANCEVSAADVKKENLVKWVNEYIADDLKFITNNKLRAFVAGQIALELGTPMPTEFTTDIADESLERINHIMYAAVTLDSHLGANGLTIRKK